MRTQDEKNVPAAGQRSAAPGEKSVLVVDVGNTTTHLGFFASGELVGTWELTTPAAGLTADEAWLQAVQALRALGASEPEGAILASVVPTLSGAWVQALMRHCGGRRPLVVGPGLKTGLKMRYDDPSELGADRVADAVAARAHYGAPAVVVDLGTTTNFDVIDASGAFAGGIIAPGVALGARSLAAAAAQLPLIDLHAPSQAIGRSTRAAMQSGVVLGEVARIDGLLDAVLSELGIDSATVVLTGDFAPSLAPLLRHAAVVDKTLTLQGLHRLWSLNQR